MLPGFIGEAQHRCTLSRQHWSIPCANMAPKWIHLWRERMGAASANLREGEEN
jgi:hypothetical protein